MKNIKILAVNLTFHLQYIELKLEKFLLIQDITLSVMDVIEIEANKH